MNNEIYSSGNKEKLLHRIKESFLQIPREHKCFGKQIFMLAKNDLIKTYKGAVIGPFWAVMKPLFQLFVYWFAFTVAMNMAGVVAMPQSRTDAPAFPSASQSTFCM